MDDLRNALRFVAGPGLGKTTPGLPAVEHFQVKHGRITGFAGSYAISAPLDLGVDCCPRVDQLTRFVKAANPSEPIALHMNGATLVANSGKLYARIATLPADKFPDYAPSGLPCPAPPRLVEALAILSAFTAGPKELREWMHGLTFEGYALWATSGAALFGADLGVVGHSQLDGVTMPRKCVDEVLRVTGSLDATVTQLQRSDRTLTFHFGDGRWLTTALIKGANTSLRETHNKHRDAALGAPAILDSAWHSNVAKLATMGAHRLHFNAGSIEAWEEDSTELLAELQTDPSTLTGTYQTQLLRKLADLCTETTLPHAWCTSLGSLTVKALSGFISGAVRSMR